MLWKVKKVLKTSLHLPVSHKLLQMYKYQFRILVQNEYAKCFFRLIQYWTGTFYSTTLIKNYILVFLIYKLNICGFWTAFLSLL